MHPKVHAGILSTNSESDEKDLAEQSIDKVDIVVCNLYPFRDTIAKINVTVEEAVEDIDIGGVTLLRAAAKNHARVCVLSDPRDYAEFLQGLDNGEVTEKSRQVYALKAFEETADFDTTIADFFRKKYASPYQHLSLKYGNNPHQKPAEVFNKNGPLPFKVLNGAPGYINLLDSLNAWPLVKELKQALKLPAAASFKVRFPQLIIPLFKPIESPETLSRDSRGPPESIVLIWRNTTACFASWSSCWRFHDTRRERSVYGRRYRRLRRIELGYCVRKGERIR